MSGQLNSESAKGAPPSPAMWPTSWGVWASRMDGSGYVLATTAQGNAAIALAPADALQMWSAKFTESDPRALYPQAFKYCPVTGEPLVQPLQRPKATWIAPVGTAEMDALWHLPRGLKQTKQSFALSKRNARRAQDDVDRQMIFPPPGRYEFFSVPAGTQMPVLLAVDPVQGLLHVWLSGSGRWEAMRLLGDGRLSEFALKRHAWRCEVSIQGADTTFFLPTCAGLARLRADVPGLCFSVDYVGGGPAVGSPIAFDGQAWMPVAHAEGVGLLAVSADGAADTLLLDVVPASLGDLQQPVSDGRCAIWPCDAGQLQVKKLANGAKQVDLLAWPPGIQPVFEFGCPHLSSDGSLWQLCFDQSQDSYVYLQLGVNDAARQDVPVPRMCTGRMAIRFTSRLKAAAWHEPEHGDDTQSDEWLLPMVESAVDGAVFGLKLQATAGAAEVMRNPNRQRVILTIDDDRGSVEFGTLAMSHPWRARVFMHDGAVWLYHPELPHLMGWELG